MRWFKHMCDSAVDERLVRLQAEYGLEGYGFYWRILEHIGSKVDGGGRGYCEFPEVFWRKSLGMTPKKFRNMLGFCEKLGLFRVDYSSDGLRITSPNILKSRDEWTRKQGRGSGETPERSRIKDPQTETNSTPKAEVNGAVRREAEANPEEDTSVFSLGEETDAFRLARFMRDRLKAELPVFREPDLAVWAGTFACALERDARLKDPVYVARVVRWAAGDKFWRCHCQNPAALVKHFDKLAANMAREESPAGGRVSSTENGMVRAVTQAQKYQQDRDLMARMIAARKKEKEDGLQAREGDDAGGRSRAAGPALPSGGLHTCPVERAGRGLV